MAFCRSDYPQSDPLVGRVFIMLLWACTRLIQGIKSGRYSRAWFNYDLVLEGVQAACSELAGQAANQDC
jgi:hypothetical protein